MELPDACLLLLVQTHTDCSDYAGTLVYLQFDAVMKETG